MRVVSGRARGTKLITIEGIETRPTTDKVKEAIFSMIQNHIYGGLALDLFSGSGALGIEFLSRGGQKCTFVELNKRAVKCIRDNLEKTKLDEEAEIKNTTVDQALESSKGRFFDVVFLDPPYHKGFIKTTIEKIVRYELLNNNGIIVLEHHIEDDESKIDYEGLDIVTQKKYGITGVTIFRRI